MKITSVIVKLFVVALFLSVATFLFMNAPYFKPTETFEKGVIRFVVDDKEVTNSLPDPVFVENDVVMISDKTAMKFFNHIFVYWDQKYDTVIITSQDDVAKIKLGENVATINGIQEEIKGTVKEIEDRVYIPISSLEKVTDVSIDFNQKVIATTQKGWSRVKVVRVAGTHSLKAYQRSISLTNGKAKNDEKLYVFDTEGKDVNEYLVARNERGDLGYILYGDIRMNRIEKINQGSEYLSYQTNLVNAKKTLVWEYAQNYTPSRTGEAKISSLNIISPTWVEVMDADLTIKSTIDSSYVAWAKLNNYTLWPTIKNDYLSMDDLSKIMNDMILRERLIDKIIKIALENHFDGINLDFENMYQKDKDVFSEFVRELASTLRRNQLTSSVDVTIAGGSETYSLCYDRTEIGKVVDYVMLMAYDQHGDWSPTAGPVASFSWVKANVEEMLQFEKVPKEKLFLCIPLYSRFWVINKETGAKIRSSAITMEQANKYLKQYKDKAIWSEEDGQYYIEYSTSGGTLTKIWIDNEEALKEKIKIVNEYNLAGIALWRWGFEDGKAIWNTIENYLEK